MSTFEDKLKDAAKLMASKSIKFRRLGIKKAVAILNSKKISYDGILLLTKGLYIALWQQDKLILQETIINKFIRIHSKIKSRETRQKFICAIFETIVREWDKLDKWRIDKFMALGRKVFVEGLFKAIKSGNIDDFVNDLFTKVLNEDVLTGIDFKIFTLRVIQEELLSPVFSLGVILTFIDALLTLVKRLPKAHAYTVDTMNLIRNLIRMLRFKGCSSEKYLKMSDFILKIGTETEHTKNFYVGLSKVCHSVAKEVEEEEASSPKKSILKNIEDKLSPKLKAISKASKDEDSEKVSKSALKSRNSLELKRIPIKEKKNDSPGRIKKRPAIENITLNNNIDQQTPDSKKKRRLSLTSVSKKDGTAEVAEPINNPNNRSLVSDLDEVMTPEKSRVSFGKIYRKKFSKNKRLSLPNLSVNSGPAPKGILKKTLNV